MLFLIVFLQLFQVLITKLLRISLNCCGTWRWRLAAGSKFRYGLCVSGR